MLFWSHAVRFGHVACYVVSRAVSCHDQAGSRAVSFFSKGIHGTRHASHTTWPARVPWHLWTIWSCCDFFTFLSLIMFFVCLNVPNKFCWCQATNHGIPGSFLDEVLNLSREFFHLPLEDKQKFTNLIDGKDFRLEGYGNDIVMKNDQIFDWNDRLYLLIQPEDQRNLAVWPTTPISFRYNLS